MHKTFGCESDDLANNMRRLGIPTDDRLNQDTTDKTTVRFTSKTTCYKIYFTALFAREREERDAKSYCNQRRRRP